MQGFFFFLLFLDSFSSQKKLGWGKKLALKIWNGRHFKGFTCFLFCSSEKFGQQIFLWRFHEIFFYRFCCQNFQWLSRHHYTHRKQQYGCGERSELHCASHSYSQQKYTLGLPDRKIFINICYSIYTVQLRVAKDFRATQVRFLTTATAAVTLTFLFVEMLCYVLGRLHSSCVLCTKIGLLRWELINKTLLNDDFSNLQSGINSFYFQEKNMTFLQKKWKVFQVKLVKNWKKYFDQKFDPLFVQDFDKRFSYSPLVLSPKPLPTSKSKICLWLLSMDSFFLTWFEQLTIH